MATRDRAAPTPFRAMYNVLDDAAALVTRYGSLSSAAGRLAILERENAELRATLAANSATHETRAQLSPGKVVDILRQMCTCVGDVGLLASMLSDALHSSDTPRTKSPVRVILSVHQVELGYAGTDSPPNAVDAGDEALTSSSEDVRSARQEPQRPRKRQRQCQHQRGDRRSSGALTPPPDGETMQWTDRIQGRIRAWRSAVGSNGKATLHDALESSTVASVCAKAARSQAITRRDQIDTTPGLWTQLGVEVAISRLGEKALAWSPPGELMAAIEERQRDPPALTIEALTELDAARPWDLVYLRRCDESYTFNYYALRSRAKAFVRAVRWFQFAFRRELWEWMHWIPMVKRYRSPEWERYRRDRDERSTRALEAWNALSSDAIKLVRTGFVPPDFFLDPSVWVMRYYQWLSWKPAGTDLVAAQADEDARYPARSFYVTKLCNHPFFSSPFSEIYTAAYALPRLVDASGKLEVHVEPANARTRPCPTSWGTTELAPVFRVVAVRHSVASDESDIKPDVHAIG